MYIDLPSLVNTTSFVRSKPPRFSGFWYALGPKSMLRAKYDQRTPAGWRNSTRSTAGHVGTRLSGPLSMMPNTAAKIVSLAPNRSSPQAMPSIGLLVSHSITGLMYPFGFGFATMSGTPRTPSTCGGNRYGGIVGTHGLSPM